MADSELKFSKLCKFQPRQRQATIEVKKKKYVLYGGAAGGGKSYWLRWQALKRLLTFNARGIKGVRIGIFCEDYPTLRDRQISRIKFEFPPWLGSYNGAEKDFILKPEWGGGIISFRNLDDVGKYLSAEFADIFVDELTRNTRDKFDFLNMRMRWPGVEDSKFVAATNPGEVGHGWVKKLWIDKNFDDETFNPNDFSFIPALHIDNKYLPKDYVHQLDSLPEQMRKAYRDGDWNIFKGQFFPEFSKTKHVIDSVDDHTQRWLDSLPAFGGLDYGYSAPSAVLWGKVTPDGTWYIGDELYQPGLTYSELGTEIKSEDRLPLSLIFADPSIWSKKDSPESGADKTGLDNLREAFNDRIIGWNFIRILLKEGKLKIFSNCKNLIRTFSDAVYDDNKTEDMNTKGEDHLLDALRYMLYSYYKVTPQQNALSYLQNASKISQKTDLDELFAPKMANAARSYTPKYKK